jgi:hypothetical protein
MNVGTAKVDITPPADMMPLELSGFVAREQPAVGVADPIFARALALEAGARRLLWVHADLLGFADPFADAFRAWAAQRLALDAGGVILSATHTHHAPATVPLLQCGQVRGAYIDFLRRRLEAAVEQAAGASSRAEVLAAQGRCGLGVDRRGKPSAHTDPRVGVVAWRSPNGRFCAVLCNYAIHNVALGHRNRRISADVTGRAAARLERELPGEPVVLFTAGGAGNVNPPSPGVSEKQLAAWGDLLANAVLGALDGARTMQDAASARSDTMPFELDALDEAQLRAHVAAHAPGPDADDYVHARMRQAFRTWQEGMLDLARSGRLPTRGQARLAVVRIGDVSLACVNAEPFSRLADDLREATGRRDVYVVGCANGLFGYLPTAEAYDEGGYETDSAFVYYNSFRPRKGTFEAVRDRLAEMIGDVESDLWA